MLGTACLPGEAFLLLVVLAAFGVGFVLWLWPYRPRPKRDRSRRM
ncbi:hypothetical protein [Allokutzneria sp. A3M-2-11 16]|nr:hypothetical protein [Allokutzneria sp. A3M-2-11 16]